MKNLFVFALAALAAYFYFTKPEIRSSIDKEVQKISQVSGGGTDSADTTIEVDVQEKINSGKYTQEEIEYFNEVALTSEYDNIDAGHACTWKTDMNIYVSNERPEYLMEELNRIVNELNDIIEPININIVENKSDANFIVCFGSESDMHKLAPGSESFTPNNWGLFTVNTGSTIKRGSMYVDIYRCKSVDGQKHLLREELTQSLGVFNDSYKYENSIFQQKWTEVTEYAPIDIRVLEMLYNN